MYTLPLSSRLLIHIFLSGSSSKDSAKGLNVMDLRFTSVRIVKDSGEPPLWTVLHDTLERTVPDSGCTLSNEVRVRTRQPSSVVRPMFRPRARSRPLLPDAGDPDGREYRLKS